ncbi:Hypothetical protein NTJ_00057 [Nesidiocoris tenuis]|uniref:Uncharacterized protein n=1 Tax=Nesidiocoris tenuis TaxID=355587 RepID=A0ABN7A8Q5_9HEMI|nr:Hypothetical protein NTJ_00057 [Nesidiocoris tenuis]
MFYKNDKANLPNFLPNLRIKFLLFFRKFDKWRGKLLESETGAGDETAAAGGAIAGRRVASMTPASPHRQGSGPDSASLSRY